MTIRDTHDALAAPSVDGLYADLWSNLGLIPQVSQRSLGLGNMCAISKSELPAIHHHEALRSPVRLGAKCTFHFEDDRCW